jgi:hypothetical protein
MPCVLIGPAILKKKQKEARHHLNGKANVSSLGFERSLQLHSVGKSFTRALNSYSS